MWLRYSIVLIVLGPYHGSIQLKLCATMLSPRRLHIASAVLIPQVPFFICRYLLLSIQVPFSTRQQAIYGTVLFTPGLLTPHTAFPSPPATTVVWNVSTHFFYPCAHSLSRCLVHAMPPQSTKIGHLPRGASAILRERYLVVTFSVTTEWLRTSGYWCWFSLSLLVKEALGVRLNIKTSL